MTADEQLFMGQPVAHVVAFYEAMRQDRIARQMRVAARSWARR